VVVDAVEVGLVVVFEGEGAGDGGSVLGKAKEQIEDLR